MFFCPNCNVHLTQTKGPFGIVWICPSCNGRAATVSLLRKNIPRDLVNELWQTARSGCCPHKRHCPACNKLMAEVPVQGGPKTELLDVCAVCQFVWFDTNEYEALPEEPRDPTPQEVLPPAARERLALLEIDAIRERAQRREGDEDAPDERWKWIPAILGMPVEYDAETFPRTPWLTWFLAAAISVLSVIAFFNLPVLVGRFGLIPSQPWRYGGLTVLTSFFLHGGVWHLLGNMYFFIVFGDNVEAWLGRWRFLLLLMMATLVGDIAHVIGSAGSSLPCVGASGGISGVIAFYALKFPRARLGFLMRLYFYVRWVSMPAYAMFFVWVAMQSFGTWAQLSGFSNISSLAHLGGAAVGFAFWLATRKE